MIQTNTVSDHSEIPYSQIDTSAFAQQIDAGDSISKAGVVQGLSSIRDSLAAHDPLAAHAPSNFSGFQLNPEEQDALGILLYFMMSYMSDQAQASNVMLKVSSSQAAQLEQQLGQLATDIQTVNTINKRIAEKEKKLRPFRIFMKVLMLPITFSFGCLLGGPVGGVSAVAVLGMNDAMSATGAWKKLSTGSHGGDAAVQLGFSILVGVLTGGATSASLAFGDAVDDTLTQSLEEPTFRNKLRAAGKVIGSKFGGAAEEDLLGDVELSDLSSNASNQVNLDLSNLTEISNEMDETMSIMGGNNREKIAKALRGELEEIAAEESGNIPENETSGVWSAIKRVASRAWGRVPSLSPGAAMGINNATNTLLAFKTTVGKDKDNGFFANFVLACGGSEEAAKSVGFALNSVLELTNLVLGYKASGDQSMTSTNVLMYLLVKRTSQLSQFAESIAQIIFGSYDLEISQHQREVLAPVVKKTTLEIGQVRVLMVAQRTQNRAAQFMLTADQSWGTAVKNALNAFFQPVTSLTQA